MRCLMRDVCLAMSSANCSIFRTPQIILPRGKDILPLRFRSRLLPFSAACRARQVQPMASVRFQEVATKAETRPTLPRSGHCASTLPDWHTDDVIVFGGYLEDGEKKRCATNEAWTFSAKDGQWSKVNYASGPQPRPRLVSQTVVLDDKMWLIAGWDPGQPGTGGDILGDVWTLDLKSYSWTQQQLQGETLEPISRFQAVAVGSKIYIHTHRSTEDILVLDTTGNAPSLRKQRVQGPAPPSRGLQSMTHVAEGNKLVVYGGAPKSGPMYGDCWALDLQSLAWQQLQPWGEAPQPRCACVAAAVSGGRILYVGGAAYKEQGGLAVNNDVFMLDTSENTWIQPSLVGVPPSARNASAMVPMGDGQGLLMHGGWKAFVETYNDTFVVTVEEPSTTTTS